MTEGRKNEGFFKTIDIYQRGYLMRTADVRFCNVAYLCLKKKGEMMEALMFCLFMFLFVLNVFMAHDGGGCVNIVGAVLCALSAVTWFARALG